MKRFRAVLAASAALALVAVGAAACGDDDASGPVTLRYSWWGNAERADLMQQAIDLFEEQNPDIRVTPSFQEYEAYWQKLTTETAGGNMPDVVQMDFSYLREYADRGVLYDLGGQAGDALVLADLLPGFDGVGEVDGTRYAVPIGGNTWSMFYNPALFAQAGVAAPQVGWTWDDYHATMATIRSTTGTYGGGNYTGVIYNLEAQLRQEGGALFTEDGRLGFDAERLARFWQQGMDLIAQDVVLPVETAVAIKPASLWVDDLAASDLGWDNFLVRYAGETDTEIHLGPLPTDNPGRLGQYLKPAMLLSASARTEHPEAAAKLISFMINDPEVGRIFGGNRGLPATNAQRDAAELDGPLAAVAAYEETIADQLTQAPPAPPRGAGGIEAAFIRISEELHYGRISVAQAVDQFFTEAEDILRS
ncbi:MULTISPECIES: ABC transporter substrate-binding protein [unclassified Solwaraspora]|uniref:ABC transporter substrate-binding protein n=1 Tax=unclassified Solwaraspora TaxID=2627926 RepID=UPI00259B84D2|nr:extracellular solute-binding protein [Solwaraspora sp. WMMA2056]WJK39117.1 extracellular solute-binding protein [Solwaraspora sp. WMMA2056]